MRIDIFILVLVLTHWLIVDSDKKPLQNNPKKAPAATIANRVGEGQPSTDTLTILGVGDIMLGTLVPSTAYLPKNNDCSPELEPTTYILKDADVSFCNLEGVFTDTPNGAKNCGDSKNCWTFGMPEKYVHCFINAGFDLISVANNHSGDFGQTGRDNTVRVLKENKLTFAGFPSHESAVFEKDGVKYGFCAFAPHKGTVEMNDYANLQRIIKKLDETCDVIIVSIHGGAEGTPHQHVTKKTETFLGNNRGNVYEFARKAIDAGADIIFGHGPHVSRAVDIYNDRFIAYSMGNFCTYSRINVSGVSGLAPIIKVFTDKEGKFLKAKIFSTYQIKSQPPKIDPQNRVLKVIKELTIQDLPESEIQISDDGTVTKK